MTKDHDPIWTDKVIEYTPLYPDSKYSTQKPKKYRKLPVEIEAVQLLWKNWSLMCDFLIDIISVDNPGRRSYSLDASDGEEGPFIEITIPTLGGDMIAQHGNWIIKDIKGEFYPCKDEIFKATYEEVI